MRFSLWPSLGHPPGDVIELARQADAAGWHGVWLADHYMPDTGTVQTAGGDLHEVWGVLPAVAAVTRRARVGTLVSPTSIHHPALLANRASTVDHVSDGRMVLGIGAGWQLNEHAAYGFDLTSRVSRFEEAVQVVRELLTNERTTFRGRFYEVVDAPCDPKPVQPRLPILVGAKGPRMLRITARHADEWNAWADADTAGPLRQRLAEACEDVGRDPATIRSSTNALISLGADPPPGRVSLTGSVDEVVDQLGRIADAGYDEFIVPDWNLGETLAERSENVARIKTEIVDQLV
ncbi:LLM class flavin-dependent oxidoreductase [Solirubrobacter soli]|uniref:LLM class flavin-dependent oxidoreductase n=1 Tax=Solirubrobacter soli TaxID=363832 RepID=UPI0004067E2F|nr:LLM class flavin-dependent oxidoreductase [Solirubrobacter soli]